MTQKAKNKAPTVSREGLFAVLLAPAAALAAAALAAAAAAGALVAAAAAAALAAAAAAAAAPLTHGFTSFRVGVPRETLAVPP